MVKEFAEKVLGMALAWLWDDVECYVKQRNLCGEGFVDLCVLRSNGVESYAIYRTMKGRRSLDYRGTDLARAQEVYELCSDAKLFAIEAQDCIERTLMLGGDGCTVELFCITHARTGAQTYKVQLRDDDGVQMLYLGEDLEEAEFLARSVAAKVEDVLAAFGDMLSVVSSMAGQFDNGEEQ